LYISNSTKVWVFIILASFALLLSGYFIGERLGLFLGLLLAIAFNVLIFFHGDSHLLKQMNARRITGQDPWGLGKIASRYAYKVGVPIPAIYLIESQSAAIFCVGRSWKTGAMALTTGLIENLSQAELESVMAHQICQIKRLDTFAFGTISVLANGILGIGRLLDKWVTRPLSLGQLDFFAKLISPIAGFVLRFVSTPSSFFLNDQLAAGVIADRFILAEALWKIQGLAYTRPLNIPPGSAHLFIVNPQGLTMKNVFLITHPPIESRIKNLVGYYPI
jgi:heat shock protein HtpX